MTMRMDAASEAKMNAAISTLARESGESLKDVLPKQMRLLAVDLAYVTTPKGKTKGDELKNMAKVIARKAMFTQAQA